MFSRLVKNICVALLYALAIGLASCDDGEEANRAEEILRASRGGDFRGVNIGDDPAKVKSTENANSVYNMPDELVYRIDPGGDDSTWYEISYNFNQQGLYDINIEIYPRDDSGVKALRKDFAAYYIEKYGDCKNYNGYCQWRAMTENGHIVSITLTDSLTEAPRPCLKVNFNESQTK